MSRVLAGGSAESLHRGGDARAVALSPAAAQEAQRRALPLAQHPRRAPRAYVERFADRVVRHRRRRVLRPGRDPGQPLRLPHQPAVADRRTHRTLKSDLLLVRPVGADAWMQFRDVFEVDGRKRPRSQRPARRSCSSSRRRSTAAQVERIMRRERPLQHRRHRADHQPAAARSDRPRRRDASPVSSSARRQQAVGEADVMGAAEAAGVRHPAGRDRRRLQRDRGFRRWSRNPQGKNLPLARAASGSCRQRATCS